ncbi:hypothetical protein BHE74_00002131 [Ensete ventricosum]|nr:hypothetical protein GW17_00025070 [Ensete ventricosum]RWW88964.1 hypothetical protein BHE74_00002131 [Ensete ventricosum]RZR95138.1 hypothetical protein BHM03_00023945 [Ensete ventricosum]
MGALPRSRRDSRKPSKFEEIGVTEEDVSRHPSDFLEGRALSASAGVADLFLLSSQSLVPSRCHLTVEELRGGGAEIL